MNPHSWAIFTKRITINAPLDEVYRAWATPGGLERWFLRKATFRSVEGKARDENALVQKGDAFTWHWHGHPDSVVEKREVISANDKDKVQFTFSGGCLVTVVLKPIGDGVVVCALTQENIPFDDNPQTSLFVGCGEGWTFYLANLKSYLEGGIDLRNKNPTITHVINS